MLKNVRRRPSSSSSSNGEARQSCLLLLGGYDDDGGGSDTSEDSIAATLSTLLPRYCWLQIRRQKRVRFATTGHDEDDEEDNNSSSSNNKNRNKSAGRYLAFLVAIAATRHLYADISSNGGGGGGSVVGGDRSRKTFLHLKRKATDDNSDSVGMPAAAVVLPAGFRSTHALTSSPIAVRRPKPLKRKYRNRDRPRHGGIKYRSIAATATKDGKGKEFARTIPENDGEIFHQQYAEQLKRSDRERHAGYVGESYLHYDEIDHRDQECRKPKWAYETHPSCNAFHEMSLDRPPPAVVEDGGGGGVDLQDLDVQYMGRGHFREGWLIDDAQRRPGFDFVLKTIRLWERDTFNPYSVSHTRTEAVTMLHTSNSNRTTNMYVTNHLLLVRSCQMLVFKIGTPTDPNVVLDIFCSFNPSRRYGHCSTSVMVERGIPYRKTINKSWGWRDQKKLDEQMKDDVVPANNYTAREKLDIVLAMAEGLADMHGNPEGPITNNDLGLDQWLRGHDGIIKLNDFNKAKILEWNDKEQQYCKFWSHQSLLYYAPEEIKGAYVDESADVNNFGKLMYIVLTGLKPYYHKGSDDKAWKAITDGEYPYVDPRYRTRSNIESRYVEIMEKTWDREPANRPTIFEVIEFLRETKARAADEDQQGKGR